MPSTALRAFHGDPKVKELYLSRVKAHRAADEIIHGVYWQKGKGCAVGCTVHSADHSAYETELGVPTWLAHLEDHLFEAMGNGRAKDWPVDFIEAIPVGADLQPVLNGFMAWLMVDPTWGVVNVTEDEEIKELCREVARRYLAGETEGPDAASFADRLRAAWEAWAAREAWEAWAAREAWEARAAREAWAAWEAREAWAAWEARAARAAWEAQYQKFVSASVDELLRLLRAADVPAETAAA